MTPLAHALVTRGLAVWNVDYRGTGADGGGWPATLLDVAAAIDHLTAVSEVDPGRVATVGHSAGGHLALWLAARHRLPLDAVGALPRVRPGAAVAQAGVLDLVDGARAGLGRGAVQALLGGDPTDQPGRYAVSSPRALVPLGVPQLLVHGEDDDDVPTTQTREYAIAATTAGDDVDAVVLPATDHFQVIDPLHEAWRLVADWVTARLGDPG
jgi:acetyl esterase/lipase